MSQGEVGPGFAAVPSGAELGEPLLLMTAPCGPVCPGKTGNPLH